MTETEAKALKTFAHHCTCGGYAWQMNGRPEASPHMAWCPQTAEYAEWWNALHPVAQPGLVDCGECRTQGCQGRCRNAGGKP